MICNKMRLTNQNLRSNGTVRQTASGGGLSSDLRSGELEKKIVDKRPTSCIVREVVAEKCQMQ